jgi:hypothetical protein
MTQLLPSEGLQLAAPNTPPIDMSAAIPIVGFIALLLALSSYENRVPMLR